MRVPRTRGHELERARGGANVTTDLARTLRAADRLRREGYVAGLREHGAKITDTVEYVAGRQAFTIGATTRDNPYPLMSPSWWRWQEGLLGNCDSQQT